MPTLAGMKSFVQSVSFDDGSGSDKGMNELICKMEEQHQLSLRQVVPILRPVDFSPYPTATRGYLLVFGKDE
jgi:hypothetical protein